jgi:hypothetical protein
MEAYEKQEIIDAIKESHQAVSQAYHDLLDNSIKAFSTQISLFEERNSEQHHQITSRQEITNGRVKCLEKETSIVRWCFRNQKLAVAIAILTLAGAIAIGIWAGVDNLISILH